MNKYVLDTNCLIHMFEYFYRSTFPSLWEKFDSFVSESRIIFVKEMKNEINRKHKSTPLVEWVKEHSNLFLPPTSEEAHFVADIFKVKHFQQLIKKQEYLVGHPVADPFIIAKAKIINGYVVTNEKHTPNAGRIPNVCKHFSIPCMNMETFMKTENWVF